jgi:hypothetical protein
MNISFCPDAFRDSCDSPVLQGKEANSTSLTPWPYISELTAQVKGSHMSPRLASPILGTVGPVPVNCSHFPTHLPSTNTWLRPCWDPWPSFPYDQEVGSHWPKNGPLTHPDLLYRTHHLWAECSLKIYSLIYYRNPPLHVPTHLSGLAHLPRQGVSYLLRQPAGV